MNRGYLRFRSGVSLALLLGLASCLAAGSALADDASTSDSLPRHPLEVRALSEPEVVLKLLRGLIENARKTGNSPELALL